MTEKKESETSEKSLKKSNLTERCRENPWILATFALGFLVLAFLIANLSASITGNVISGNTAGQKLVDYYTSLGVENLSLDSVKEVSGLYQVNVLYNGNIVPLYITKDGENTIEYLNPLEEKEESVSDDKSTTTEVPKSDKPVVELFVMSYCPYGTQAEKGIIPAVELLGDKIDFKIRYVYYAMHGEKEVTENLREYCIQEIAPEKFLDYMYCFLEGDGVESSSGYITNGNDPATCLRKAGVDTTSLSKCISETDKKYSVTKNLEDKSSWLSGSYPKFNVDKELNDEYDVAGSPTLVINGVQATSARDSTSYLDVICSAFKNAPEECGEVLSSSSPSAYFGWENTGSSTTASCG